MVYFSPIALVGVAASALSSIASAEDFARVARPFLDQHCVRCHGDASAESNFLDLAVPTSTGASEAEGAPDWGWLLDQVEFGDMPPPGEAAPTDEERAAFVAWLRADLGEEAGAAPGAATPLPRAGLRRLSVSEYENAVLDALGVSVDLSSTLPEDAVGHSFDHVASAQSMSEAHFVRYLEAAEAVAESALPLALLNGEPRTTRYFPGDLVGGRGTARGRFLWTNGDVTTRSPLASGGRYRIRAEVYGDQAGPDPCRARLVLGGKASKTVFDVGATDEAPAIIEAELHATASDGAEELVVGVRFLNDYFRKPTEDQPAQDRNLMVRWVEVEGPLDGGEPTRFMERWGEEAASELSLQERVEACAEILWRRPIDHATDPVIAQLLGLSSESDSPAHRMRAALVGMLASPRFLFFSQVESEDPVPSARGAVAMDGPTFAARIVSFLWRSIPDEAFWEEYRNARSWEPEVLVARMLADPRSNRFARSFVDQWLQLRSTSIKRPDRRLFPEMSQQLRASMLEETRRVFIASMRERRSLWELVDGAETIVDRRLAKHYQLGAEAFGSRARLPRGDEWQRASLAETPRRGLLGQGAILFGTSEATRTSPVSRGRWVLDVLLGSAPPPPPPGADNLAPLKKGAAAKPLRERMELHREAASCAACHARMDPIGFGLERFDAVGAERSVDDPSAQDLVGRLPDGRVFDGPVELSAVLREEPRFLEALAERLLVFALGRGLERSDRGAVQAILAGLDPAHPTLFDMLVAIVQLEEFDSMTPAPLQRPGTGSQDDE